MLGSTLAKQTCLIELTSWFTWMLDAEGTTFVRTAINSALAKALAKPHDQRIQKEKKLILYKFEVMGRCSRRLYLRP